MGKGHIESELKYALDAAGYRRLCRRFPGAKQVRQDNLYFDDPATLWASKHDLGIRIRRSPGRAPVLTVKAPTSLGKTKVAGHRARLELEERIPAGVARKLSIGKLSLESVDSPPAALLRKGLPTAVLKRLAPLGSVTNVRTVVSIDDELTLEIDRFTFFGQTEYELEVETSRPKFTDAVVRAMLRDLNIPSRPRNTTKLALFLKAYKARKKKTATTR